MNVYPSLVGVSGAVTNIPSSTDCVFIAVPPFVSKTTLSRKLTLGGITKAYPVYRVRLDQLFYNDQNDRIATWITQYKNDTSNISFSDVSSELYTVISLRQIGFLLNMMFSSTTHVVA